MTQRRAGVHSARRSRRGATWGMVVICVLAAALVALSCFTVYLAYRTKGTTSDMEKKLAQVSAQLADRDATIDQQQATIDQQQGTINEQENTIQDQQDEIADLRVQIALQNTRPGDPNLPPEGEYSDYEGQKIVALTFDDGPGPYTERLLDALQERGARATFFVLGTRVDAYPRLIRRMAEEGHVVGNHSNAHNMLHKMDLVGVRKEMGTCAEKIEKVLGYRPPVMRCPGGNSSDIVKQYAKEAGIPILYWSVDTRDWESKNKDAILEIAKKNIKDGSIVLMHDIYSVSVDAAIELMDWLIEEGYTMVTVPELLHARCGGSVPGVTYTGIR